MILTYLGEKIGTDKQGYLLDFKQWIEELADLIAQNDQF